MGWRGEAAAPLPPRLPIFGYLEVSCDKHLGLLKLLCVEIILICYLLLSFVKFNFGVCICVSIFNLFCLVNGKCGKYACEICYICYLIYEVYLFKKSGTKYKVC